MRPAALSVTLSYKSDEEIAIGLRPLYNKPGIQITRLNVRLARKKWNPSKKELSLILAAFYPSRETSMRASRSPLLPKM